MGTWCSCCHHCFGFLANNLIENEKLRPLVPMLVGIISLSVITLLDKNDEENKAWTIATWDFAKLDNPVACNWCCYSWISVWFNPRWKDHCRSNSQ